MVFFSILNAAGKMQLNSMEPSATVLVFYPGTWDSRTKSPWSPMRAEDAPVGRRCKLDNGPELGLKR